MAGEKKRRRLRRSRYVKKTLNQNQILPTTPPQTTLHQPSISIDTDRNLDLDLRQTGSRSIDLDSENSRSSRSPQPRPSFRSSTSLQEADKPIRIRSTSPLPRLHLTSDRQILHLHRQLPQIMTISIL